MSNDIRDIIERLAILEGRITPTTVKHGLNPQQKSVPQLPALFKPKHISVLQNKTDPKHPMSGYMVGASESIEESAMAEVDLLMQEIGSGAVDIYDVYAHPSNDIEKYVSGIIQNMYDDVAINHRLHPDDNYEEILDIVADQIAQDYPADEQVNEAVTTEEKLLDKVKKSLTDYLASVEEKIEKKIDKELSNRPVDHELGKKEKKDRDLIAKDKDNKEKVDEDPTQENPVTQAASIPDVNPTYAESAPVKTITLEDGRVCEIHGNEHTGFAIRHGNRQLKSRFRNLAEAEMALEMFRARCGKNSDSNDYLDEA